MGKIYETNKDRILSDLEDIYKLNLSEEEYSELSKLSTSTLFLISILLARATKKDNRHEF